MGVTIEVTPGLMVGQGTTLVFPARAADKPPIDKPPIDSTV